jgi:hypothetical protein
MSPVSDVPVDVIRGLADAVEVNGLALFLAAFPPHSASRERWAREATALTGVQRDLVDLFLLGRSVPAQRLPAGVVAALPVLAKYELVRLDADRATLPEAVLFRPLGTWMFAEPPGPLVVGRYFGPDSVALAMHATVRPGSTCLDLCSGPGFQALRAAGRARVVTAVELCIDVAELAAVNAALNGITDRVDVRCGDLYSPLDPNVRYDHVLANIPFIPVPDGLPFPAAGAGGPDGFSLGRRVLDGLPDRLADGGTAHLAALLLAEGGKPVLADELSGWAASANCRMTVTLVGNMPVGEDSPLVRSTAAAIMEAGANPDDNVAERVAALYAGGAGRTASWAFLRVDAGRSGFEVVDLGRSGRGLPWVSMI